MLLIKITIIVSYLALEIKSLHLKNCLSHQYWFNNYQASPSILNSDWNYCDLKCLYLEHYADNIDFVVIVFSAFWRDDFSACYVKKESGYVLWNKIITNAYYQKYCGEDYKDWVTDSTFKIKRVYGEGRGVQVAENQILKQ